MFTLAADVQSSRFVRKQQKCSSTQSFTGVFWQSSMCNSSEKGERLNVSSCLWHFVCDLWKGFVFGHICNTLTPAVLTRVWSNPEQSYHVQVFRTCNRNVMIWCVMHLLTLTDALNWSRREMNNKKDIILIKQWLGGSILWLSSLFWLTGGITDTTQ